MLARAHQSMIWSRQHETNRLRSLLREYYPAALVMAGDDLAGRDAVAVLTAAPTPTKGRALSVKRIEQVLRKAGRQRNITVTAGRIHDAVRSEQLPPRDGLEAAYGASALALLNVIAAMNAQITQLQGQVEAVFRCHPDAEILTSQPGMGTILGARVLGEFGDDPHRYADVRSRRNYSGMSPTTRTSGSKRVVLARYARHKRLVDALAQQALGALSASPGARAYYDQLRPKGSTNSQAFRAVSRRLVGILHACLRDRTRYDEATAWHHAHAHAA